LSPVCSAPRAMILVNESMVDNECGVVRSTNGGLRKLQM
jgi:hypothetical protein